MPSPAQPASAIDVRDVTRRFGARDVPRGVPLRVRGGEVHALHGPNGAGETTLLRILSELVDRTSGTVGVTTRAGLVPFGDRTFYLRISGLENLAFSARMHGMRRAQAKRRATELLATVGLEDVAQRPVGATRTGCRTAVVRARAAWPSPRCCSSTRRRATSTRRAPSASATRRASSPAPAPRSFGRPQHVDEIFGFAGAVTSLHHGEVRFAGSVPELIARGDASPRYVLRVRNGRPVRRDLLVAWSYKLAFFTDIVNIAAQAFVFSLIGQLVDPQRLPAYDGTHASYMEFAAIGIVLAFVLAFVPFVWELGLVSAATIPTFRRGAGGAAAVAALLGLAGGALFLVELLPGWLSWITAVNPIAIALDGVREVLLGGGGWGEVGPAVALLVPLSVLSLAIGAAALRLALRRERRLGTLGLC